MRKIMFVLTTFWFGLNLTQALAQTNVPNDFPTIQDAVNGGQKDIVVEPGMYRECIEIKSGTIRAAIPNTVVIDCRTRNTINSTIGDLVRLQGLIIVNTQAPAYYSTAAVLVDLGGSLDMTGCTIITKSHGVVVNYTNSTLLRNNKFIGDPNNLTGIGVALYHQNHATVDKGAKLFGNEFMRLATGVSVNVNNYYPPILYEGSTGNADTNFFAKSVKQNYR